MASENNVPESEPVRLADDPYTHMSASTQFHATPFTHPLMGMDGVTAPESYVVVAVEQDRHLLKSKWIVEGFYSKEEGEQIADHYRLEGERMLVQRLHLHLGSRAFYAPS